MLDASSMLCNVDIKKGKFVTALAVVRGRTVSPIEVAQSMEQLRKDNEEQFVNFISNGFKYTICNEPS